ncbi:MAG: hypothetical protein RLZ10_1459 [Bacteroidota bacterium]|jgi:hypothetical protein
MKTFLLLFLLTPLAIFSQIENGLVAHFPFNNDFSDISVSQIQVTNHGALFGLDRNGVANNGVDFNNSGYISLNGNSLKKQLPITVSYWIKLNSISNVNTFFKTDNIYDNHYGIWMNNLPTGGVTLSFGAGLGSSSSTNQRYYTTDATISTNTITANTWHHIVGIIRNYNDMEIYIDCRKTTGSYGGTGSTSIGYSSTGEPRIGGSIGGPSHPNDFYLDGSMDQFAFWNRELTVAEIDLLCNTYNTLNTIDINAKQKSLVKITDLLGREINDMKSNEPLLYIYDNGTVEKIIILEK